MIPLKLLRQRKILVCKDIGSIKWQIFLLFIVIKAQLISNDSVQAGEDYVFPSQNDDLSDFTGGNTQITFSNDVLKDVLNQLPPGIYMTDLWNYYCGVYVCACA